MGKDNQKHSFFMKAAGRGIIAGMLVMALLMAAYTPGVAAGTPYTNIVSVVKDTSVTITGYNFPVDQTFTVRMNN
jgi:hypothetical protein